MIVPFDFSSLETVLMLLIIAPILEELIFRFALWNSLGAFIKNNLPILLITSVLFSVGHFMSYWSIPKKFQGFVLYQTFYTFILALYAGFQKIKNKTIVAAIHVHFFFNLGFFLGSKFL